METGWSSFGIQSKPKHLWNKMSLGETYTIQFKIGDYVTWRTLSHEGEEYYTQYYGVVTEIIHYKDNVRPVYYAKVLENKTSDTFYVVLSCLTKVETN